MIWDRLSAGKWRMRSGSLIVFYACLQMNWKPLSVQLSAMSSGTSRGEGNTFTPERRHLLWKPQRQPTHSSSWVMRPTSAINWPLLLPERRPWKRLFNRSKNKSQQWLMSFEIPVFSVYWVSICTSTIWLRRNWGPIWCQMSQTLPLSQWYVYPRT